jgi:hypothetical protein
VTSSEDVVKRTNWPSLQHQFPDQGISATLVQVSLSKSQIKN